MEKRLLVAVLVCLTVVACEPRSSPQKPKTNEHAATVSLLMPFFGERQSRTSSSSQSSVLFAGE